MSDELVQQSLDRINGKIDDLTNMLPNTYVTIRAHDLQIRIHDERLADTATRLVELEKWSRVATDRANQEHSDMRREWNNEIKGMNAAIDDMKTSVTKMTEIMGMQNKIWLWLLGIFTSVIVSLIIAFSAHIHF